MRAQATSKKKSQLIITKFGFIKIVVNKDLQEAIARASSRRFRVSGLLPTKGPLTRGQGGGMGGI